MTNAPIRDEEPRDIDTATVDELENMLADAERNIHAIRAELAEREGAQHHQDPPRRHPRGARGPRRGQGRHVGIARGRLVRRHGRRTPIRRTQMGVHYSLTLRLPSGPGTFVG